MKAHDAKVAVWGIIGALGLFAFSVFLASLGPYIESKTNKEQEDSQMFIDDTVIDDIRDDLMDASIEINGQQYVLVDTAMETLQGYLEDTED